jgi:3-keto-disaccharide hydrolase
VINYDGKSEEKDKSLWSKKSYADFILIADVRLTRKPEPELSPVILPNGENALNPDGSKKQVYIPYNGDTGIYLRGNSKSQVNIGNRYIGSGEIYGYRTDTTLPAEVRAAVTPKVKADRPPGEWNRFVIIMKGSRVSVMLNGIQVIQDALLPGIPATGPLALQDDHADNNQFQFANLFIKEL